MKIHFAYYNQYKNGIDIAFADNTLLFLSCAEAEKNLHTTPNSEKLIDNLAIDNPLMYAALALDCELQDWADAMWIYVQHDVVEMADGMECNTITFAVPPTDTYLDEWQ